jgi:hypothetical protein
VTDKKRRPGLSDRGDADDLESGQADHSRRRGDVPWGVRHRSRVNRIFDAAYQQRAGDHELTASELRAVERAAAHLRDLNLYGSWQISESARVAWRCQRCPCHRREVA